MRIWLSLFVLVAFTTVAEADKAPLGRWLTASGNVVIEIAPCGPTLCGRVVEVLANRSMEDSRKTVANRATIGMKILSDFAPYGDDAWQGHIYNRENGKTYDCLISLEGPGQLKVRPYIFISLIGQTQMWKRV